MVNDDEFLPPPPGMMPAVREADLKKLQEETVVTFPKTKLAELVLGQMCYCIFKVQSTNWGYLSVVEKIEGKKVHVRVANNAKFLKTGNTETPLNVLDVEKEKDAYLVPAAVHPHAAALSSDVEIMAALKQNKTMKRLTDVKWEPRFQVLVKTVSKAQRLEAEQGVVAEFESVEPILTDEVKEAQDAMGAAAENGAPEFFWGEKPTNVNAVIDILIELRGKQAQRGARANFDVSGLADGVQKNGNALAELAALVKTMVVDRASGASSAPASPMAGTTSMSGEDEKCAWHAAGEAIDLSSGSNANKIGEEHAKKIDNAQEHAVKNIIRMAEDSADFVEHENWSELEKKTGELWKEVLGMPPQELLDAVLAKKQWGGYVELAAALHHTSTQVVIVHADSVHAKATDQEVEAGVHAADLVGLPAGPAKAKQVFVVLKGAHYHLGHVTKNGVKQAIFSIGAEADEAKALLVAALKLENKGPLEDLSGAEREQQIAKVFEERRKSAKEAIDIAKKAPPSSRVSFADALGRARPRTQSVGSSSRSSSKSASPSRGKPKSGKLCRNFEADGKCSYGKKCDFVHKAKPAGEPWQTVENKRKRKNKQRQCALKVHSKLDWHPSKWRQKLKQFDAETHRLTKWIEREGNWFMLLANPKHVDKLLDRLTPLRKAGLTVEVVHADSDDAGGSDDAAETGVCSAFMSGQGCEHEACQ